MNGYSVYGNVDLSTCNGNISGGIVISHIFVSYRVTVLLDNNRMCSLLSVFNVR
jgi:hypothetical protein